ncbi:hypothetical protein BAUCODRAFT_52249, partial [Baudoinia panamericana UAMH 10762]
WYCSACFEEHDTERFIANGDQVCAPVLEEVFKRALLSEPDFPPRWGRTELDPWQYRRVVNTLYMKKYEKKAKEWSVPETMRIYCQHTDRPRHSEPCNTFLGKWELSKYLRKCEKCNWYTCLRCRETHSTSDAAGRKAKMTHDCDPDTVVQGREEAFKGLVRGKDYQDCPNDQCRTRIELKEACNHVTCNCGTEFCYLCG